MARRRDVGEFIIWLVERNPELEVYLLRWDLGALKTLFRGITIAHPARAGCAIRASTLKLDARHPAGASHHQKIVVIDDCFAFCGGIDMTAERWDTREHRDDDPRRVGPDGSPTALARCDDGAARGRSPRRSANWRAIAGAARRRQADRRVASRQRLLARRCSTPHFPDVEVGDRRAPRPEMAGRTNVREIERSIST